MVKRKIPALIIITESYDISAFYNTHRDVKSYFDYFRNLDDDKVIKIYFGDKVNDLLKMSERNDI